MLFKRPIEPEISRYLARGKSILLLPKRGKKKPLVRNLGVSSVTA